MLTVTTDPDLNSNEVFRTPLRANYTGMQRLGLPRTVLEADLLASVPKSKNHRWSGVTFSIKNMFGVVPKFRHLHCRRGVAVTVAVHCSTPATFQAFTGDPLCAQDFFKLFARCDLPIYVLLTVDDS